MHLLCEPAHESQFTNALTYGLSAVRQQFSTLQIRLTASRWHVTSTLRSNVNLPLLVLLISGRRGTHRFVHERLDTRRLTAT